MLARVESDHDGGHILKRKNFYASQADRGIKSVKFGISGTNEGAEAPSSGKAAVTALNEDGSRCRINVPGSHF